MKNVPGVLAMVGMLAATPALAQVPQTLSYQGRLAAHSTNFTGTAQLKFALVNAAGTLSFWGNDGTSAGGGQPASAIAEPVTNGLFMVMLGDTNIIHMTAIPPNAFTNADRSWRDLAAAGGIAFGQLAVAGGLCRWEQMRRRLGGEWHLYLVGFRSDLGDPNERFLAIRSFLR